MIGQLVIIYKRMQNTNTKEETDIEKEVLIAIEPI